MSRSHTRADRAKVEDWEPTPLSARTLKTIVVEKDPSNLNTKSIPRVLTRSVIPTLAVTSLDAGDAVECYHLTRATLLEGTNIRITKSALGVRYRRPAYEMMYYNDDEEKPSQRLELTIEFGAARGGPDATHESMPRLVYRNSDRNATPDDALPVSVEWDNAGRVYYTERIDSDTYTTANYLASLSGTVLTKLLQSAMDFITLPPMALSKHTSNIMDGSATASKRIRRYQPFAVTLVNDTSSATDEPNVIFNSSNDADFVQHVLSALAELGVAIQPVILPTTFHIQLHAATPVQKVKVHPGGTTETSSSHKSMNVTSIDAFHPPLFYQKLYTCIQAIASANYAAYNTTVMTTSSSTTNSGTNATVVTTRAPVSMLVRPPTPRALRYDDRPTAAAFHEGGPRRWQAASPWPTTTVSKSAAPVPAATVPTVPGSTATPTMAPMVSTPNATESIPLPPEGDETSMATHQEQAATAAQQAQIAANAAGDASTEEQAVSAAQQAAVYAHKAATVTAQQAASMARDAIVSGVGSSVAQAVALCFSDPLYGLATPTLSNGTGSNNATLDEKNASAAPKKSTTTAYLYWDGVYYYQVNLTAPYVTVASTVRAMPQPPVMRIGAEDFVDWAIALLLFACASIGFLLLLQQIMGRNLKVIRPLYRYQRWFFAPTHFAWKDIVSDDSESVSTRGLGQQYTFGEDVIPLSMGGRRPRWLNGGNTREGSDPHSFDDDDFDLDDETNNTYDNGHGMNSAMAHDLILGDLELTETSRPRTPTPQSYNRGQSFISDISGGVVDEDLDRIVPQTAPVRLYRDPNLVDLPDLTSNSKVAIPVSVSLGNHTMD